VYPTFLPVFFLFLNYGIFSGLYYGNYSAIEAEFGNSYVICVEK